MNRSVASRYERPCVGSLVLTLGLLFLGGCSGGGGRDGEQIGQQFGLDKSEFIALKKSSKTSREFRGAILKHQLEKAGATIEATKSKNVTKRGR